MAFVQDFKTFIAKGNVVDLAVGVVIGAAFGKVVTALVEGAIMPLVSYLLPSGEWQKLMIGKIEIGKILAAGVDFLLLALVVFAVFVKGFGMLMRRSEANAAVSNKKCPECLESIPLAARRCKACSSEQPEMVKA
jgi:large conductance mechanosensitive channel